MTITTRADNSDLARLLNELRGALKRARASADHQDVLDLLQLVRDARETSADVEGHHVDRALGEAGFDLLEAQAELRLLRSRLAGLALKVQESLYGRLSSDDRRSLSMVAIFELDAHMVDLEQLEVIRRAHAAIRAKRANA